MIIRTPPGLRQVVAGVRAVRSNTGNTRIDGALRCRRLETADQLLLVGVFGTEIDESAVTQGETNVDSSPPGIFAFVIPAKLTFSLPSLVIVAQDKVDYAGDGI